MSGRAPGFPLLHLLSLLLGSGILRFTVAAAISGPLQETAVAAINTGQFVAALGNDSVQLILLEAPLITCVGQGPALGCQMAAGPLCHQPMCAFESRSVDRLRSLASFSPPRSLSPEKWPGMDVVSVGRNVTIQPAPGWLGYPALDFSTQVWHAHRSYHDL